MIIAVVHTIFVVVFAFMEDIEDNLQDPTVYDDLEAKETTSIILSIVLQAIFFFAEGFAFYFIHYKSKKTLEVMMQFHDYLVQYRLTPRSRILRKHLPKMTMVVEEESNMDTSSIMLS